MRTHGQICVRMQILHICKICIRMQIWSCVHGLNLWLKRFDAFTVKRKTFQQQCFVNPVTVHAQIHRGGGGTGVPDPNSIFQKWVFAMPKFVESLWSESGPTQVWRWTPTHPLSGKIFWICASCSHKIKTRIPVFKMNIRIVYW